MSTTLKCPKCSNILVEQGDMSKSKAVEEGREYMVLSTSIMINTDSVRLVKCLVCNNIDSVYAFDDL